MLAAACMPILIHTLLAMTKICSSFIQLSLLFLSAFHLDPWIVQVKVSCSVSQCLSQWWLSVQTTVHNRYKWMNWWMNLNSHWTISFLLCQACGMPFSVRGLNWFSQSLPFLIRCSSTGSLQWTLFLCPDCSRTQMLSKVCLPSAGIPIYSWTLHPYQEMFTSSLVSPDAQWHHYTVVLRLPRSRPFGTSPPFSLTLWHLNSEKYTFN